MPTLNLVLDNTPGGISKGGKDSLCFEEDFVQCDDKTKWGSLPMSFTPTRL